MGVSVCSCQPTAVIVPWNLLYHLEHKHLLPSISPSAGPRPSPGSSCLRGLTASKAQELSGLLNEFLRSSAGLQTVLALRIFICQDLEPRPLGDQFTGLPPWQRPQSNPTWEIQLFSEVWSSESGFCCFLLPEVQGWGK